MKIIMAIGAGSFIGGVSRYVLSIMIQNKAFSTFPFGTLTVNLLGCFLIGLVYGLSEKGNISPDWRLFMATGVLGGFTTFSAFSNETIGMLREGQVLFAFSYVFASVVFGLALTFIGILMTKIF